jgi:excinuclease UvrABC nuclease subunit
MGGIEDLVQQFDSEEFQRPYISVVYGFYDQREEEWLYIGKTKNAISRLDDHLNNRDKGSNLLTFLGNEDDGRNQYYDAKEYIRRHVGLKFVEIPDKSRRSRVERRLINKHNPVYNTQ